MRFTSQPTPMALLLFALIACLLIPAPSVAHESSVPEQPEWVLPPVQWTKDLDSGYVSTKPLIFDDLVIVKVGGKSDSPGGPWDEGKAPGLYAFHLQNGTLAWRYSNQQSTTGFEISPILNVREHQMVVNGWTSGHVTAHDLQSGELLWSTETESVAWGVTGELFYYSGTQNDTTKSVHVPGETAFYGLSPDNGSTLFKNSLSEQQTGYRNGIGIIYLGLISENREWGFAAGDESGNLYSWSTNGSNFTTWDVPSITGLSGSWKIRTPPSFVTLLGQNDSFGVQVILQGVEESRLVVLDIQPNGAVSNYSSKTLGIAPSIPINLGGATITGDFDSVIFHCFFLATNCEYEFVIDEGPVTGELSELKGDNHSSLELAVPHNTESGYWTGISIYVNGTNWTHTLRWDWHPQKAGWLTAGVGGNASVMAAANDASWLEVRYFTEDVEGALGPTNGTGQTGQDYSPKIHATTTGLSIDSEILLVITLFFSTAGLALGSRKSLTAGSLGLLIVALILLPVLNTAWVTGVADQAPDHEVDRSGFPDSWEDSQIICFEFPEDVWQGEAGETRFLDSAGVELKSVEDDQTRTCVGGLEGHETVGSLTHAGADASGFEVGFDQQPLGIFIEDIGPGIGGDGDRWWLYWVDGKHGNLAVDAQPLSESSIVEWRFL